MPIILLITPICAVDWLACREHTPDNLVWKSTCAGTTILSNALHEQPFHTLNTVQLTSSSNKPQSLHAYFLLRTVRFSHL